MDAVLVLLKEVDTLVLTAICVTSRQLQDGMDRYWEPVHIAEALRQYPNISNINTASPHIYHKQQAPDI